ncbi:MAG: ATP-binding protein [Candidatus Obscuribacterales bacterium]
MEVSKLVQQPESKTLEFKQDLSSLKPILKTVVAFANTAGGTLIVGRSSDGKVCGVPDPLSAEEQIANAIADNIRPSLLPEIEVATVEGKELLIIQVAHWKGPFYLKDQGIPNGVYVRLGSTSRPANSDTLQEMKRQAAHASYDQEPLVQLKETDLDLDAIERAFSNAGKSMNKPKMVSCGLLHEYHHHLVPTVGGLILFGKEEVRMRHVPDARVSCARFRGRDKTHILDRLEMTGTLVDAVDPTLKFIARNTRLGAEITQTHRIDIPEYPPLATREALINALVHADYTIKGSHTRISIFDDRLEILNSGMLPFGFTLEDLFSGISRVRNRVIARVFRELNQMEEWGSGYQRMIAECDAKGYLHPIWSEAASWIQVTFFPHPATTLTSKTDVPFLSKRQQQIVQIIRAHQSISADQISQQIKGSISLRTLYRELATLRQLGIINPAGHGPSRTWTASSSST